ncbi:hypothetical protein V8G54_011693 [Vigna mungo]|uniref:Uncharacterized protein n=1 Tax=Vigna mungo TaxID=3915 RepID=A0AAQ3NS36_VIGMU
MLRVTEPMSGKNSVMLCLVTFLQFIWDGYTFLSLRYEVKLNGPSLIHASVYLAACMQFVGRDIDYLIPPFLKNKLVFCWDGSYCTEGWIYKQGKKSIVYSKDLRKLWQKGDPNLPWNKLYYNESNTLMLDVCPYRGMLNPRTTTVYPLPFNYHDNNDNSLAQGGELRAYLQGLTEVDDMRKYVKEHPFGQEAINNASINWITHSRYILEYRMDKTFFV